MMKKGGMMLLFGVFFASFVVAGDIDVTNITAPYMSCSTRTGETIVLDYYLNNQIFVQNPYDQFSNTVTSWVRNGSGNSRVDIWANNGVITNCNDWNRVSNIVPANAGMKLIMLANSCTFNKPTYSKILAPLAIDAQIHFSIAYHLVVPSSNTPNTQLSGKFAYKAEGESLWTCYPGNASFSDANSCASTVIHYKNEQKRHNGECINYRMFWCGDGLLNHPEGGTSYDNGLFVEECDPEHSDYKDLGTCNADCKLIIPKCNPSYHQTSGYNNNFPIPRLDSTMPLCNPGEVISFQGPDALGKYTWGCKNGHISTSSTTCVAQDQWCGDGMINGEEQCDPNDLTEIGRGTAGCSIACLPINPPTIPVISITKQRIGDANKVYSFGEEVGFRMNFTNTSSTTGYNVIIRDTLPQNLEYVSSQIFGVTSLYSGTYVDFNGLSVVEYSGFDLGPNQQGYLLLTGKVTTDYLYQTKNTVCIYSAGRRLARNCDHADYTTQLPSVSLEKSVNKTYVQSGETVEFSIKVSVTTGAYTGLLVYDMLPDGLVYEPGSRRIADKTNGLALHASFSDTPRLEWNVSFPQGFKEGEFFVIKFNVLLTEATQLKYTNIACVENGTVICDPEDIWTVTDLTIKKYVNNQLDDSGRDDNSMSFVQNTTGYFTIEVFNATAPLTGFRVEDVIENNLLYLDSMYLPNDLFTGTIILSGNRNVDYVITPVLSSIGSNYTKIEWNISFQTGYFLPGDKLIIKFLAKVKGNETNIAHVYYPQGISIEWGHKQDPAAVNVLGTNTKLLIKKYVNNKLDNNGRNDDNMQFSIGDTAYFTIEVQNTTEPVKSFRIRDIIPANLEYLDSTALGNNAFTGIILFTGNRNPAYNINLSLTGQTTNPEIYWEVEMLEDAFIPGDVFKAQFMVKVNGGTTNTAYVYYPKIDGTEGINQDPAAVSVGGGSGGGGGGGGWSGGGGSRPKCGDGYRNGMEMCDRGSNGGWIEGGKMFEKENYVDERYKDKKVFCTSSCMLEELPACFNTQNGSPSIMKGEVLPFYFNLEGVLGKDVDMVGYQKNLQDHFFISDGKTQTCTSADENKIDLRTMMCSFEVYGPGEGNKNIVYSATLPCMNLNGWSDSKGNLYPRIESFIKQNQYGRFGGSMLNQAGEVKNVFSTLDDGWQNYPTLLPLSSKALIQDFGTNTMKIKDANKETKKVPIDKFGEYKLSWTKIEFSYCADTGKKDDKGNLLYQLTEYVKGYDRVCEVDFAVTDHYLIQKSPYGIGTKASVSLENYQLKNGSKFLTEYAKYLQGGGTDYAVSAEVGQTFSNFQKKYDKIAVKLKDNLYKVPGKSIYLYKGNDTVDLKNMLGDNVKTAFTFITDKDILIKGNLETNAMIMTKGKIEIDASLSCNGRKGQNSTEGQLLQGIFYAGAGFKSVGHDKLKNTVANLNTSERCNYGNLRIQGVVFGDLSDIVANRRSELYTRFEGVGGGTDGKEKADKVLNGGSVLVEYYPGLWGDLPPGGEEFNKILSVYR